MLAIFADTAKTERNPSGYVHGTQCTRHVDIRNMLADRKNNDQAFPGEHVAVVQPGDIPSGWA
jgi:hypothetical protein